jgi:SAM-dependent methyltransferase
LCTINCILFGVNNLRDEEIAGKQILEVGACNVNGSLRPFVESRKPAMYIGADIERGTGVDVICNAENLEVAFEEGCFDVVISTELLEHVRNWRSVISSIKKVCKPGGIILITTRSIGFGYHAYPYDFWRYEIEDMRYIFSDCLIEVLEKDPEKGVFAKIRKPLEYSEKDLGNYALYNIVVGKKTLQATNKDFKRWHYINIIIKLKTNNAYSKIMSKISKEPRKYERMVTLKRNRNVF